MTAVLPTSRIPDPADAPPLGWGILAPGNIALGMAHALRAATRQRIVACGSRSLDRAEAFARRWEIPSAYGSYAELLDDPGVDIVYIASPHSEHRDQALAALAAGKHVLIEKAFTRNATEAREIADAARAADRACMEAMWTRFLPRHDIVRHLLADGALGEIESVVADHGQAFEFQPGHRMFEPALAGGALLDLGIYPVSFAWFVLGRPGRVTARGTLTSTGVDRQVAAVFDGYPGSDAMASVTTTLAARTPARAVIAGPAGRIELDEVFYRPGSVRLVTPRGDWAEAGVPEGAKQHGLAYEAAHFATLVADGRRESPLLPLAETIAIMETLDDIRAQVGVRFPGED